MARVIWLAGCAFGFWVLWHWDLWRELMALVVAGSVVLWCVGGAAILGRRAGRSSSMSRGKRPWLQEPKASEEERSR